ncbi:hypothetical protein [Listeria monocytogenes]|uniref:hypothetical protein n=1 Tax=Listeria monocytogenes TaxID=1639 RepID=UPI0021CAFF5E|nr:hypothetical protein [Listeria monocytogenes]
MVSSACLFRNQVFIAADLNEWTTPAIYGNVDVTKYNKGAGIYTSSTTKYTNVASDTCIKSRKK